MLHRRLEEIGPDDLAIYGGKAYHLAEAKRLGCPVPEAMVLSTQLYSRFLEQGGLDGEILSILSTMQPSAMHQFRAAEWAINSAFAMRRLPKSVREEILDLTPMLEEGSVVVRSSAVTESGIAHSFVGQHSSYTNITTPEELVQAVLDCWQSMYSARALHYAHHFGVNLLRSAMAVIVQRQVQVVRKGALFTANPVSGNPDEFMMQSLEKDGAVAVRTLNPYDPSSCESYLERQMLRYGLLLDEHLKQYQVVEWATDATQVWLLGVRPITGVPPYLPAKPDGGELGSRWNLINPYGWDGRELPPYSWYHRSRARDIRYALEEGQARHQARATDERYLRGYRYLPALLTRSTGRGRMSRSVPAVVRQLGMTARTERDYVGQRHIHDSLLDEVWNRDWHVLENRELGEQLHKAIFLSHAYMSAAVRIAADASTIKDLFDRVHAEWVGGDIDSQELVAAQSRAQLDLERKAAALYARSTEDQKLDELLVESFWDKRYLLVDPALIEQTWDIALLYPDWSALKQRVQAYARSANHTLEAAQEDEERLLRLKKMASSRVRGLQKLLYDRLLNRTQSLLRLNVSRLEPVACSLLAEHEILEEVGVRLADQGLAESKQEAALLEYREVQDWLRGRLGKEVQERIADRRKLYRQWWRYRPPQVLVIEPAQATDTVTEETQASVKGLAVSPGEATGRVRVLHGPGESASLLAGEVLVVDDPLAEYSPLFSIASAVVCRQGSLLDHAATLAREYGVPTVFSLPDATTIFKTGDIVHVNARDGVVSSENGTTVLWDS